MGVRKLILIAGIFGLTGAGIAHADDVGPDKAVKLLQEGKIQSFEKLNEAALAKHPGATIEETELEKEYNGYAYEVELRNADGVEWNVELDAESGKIIRDYKDD